MMKQEQNSTMKKAVVTAVTVAFAAGIATPAFACGDPVFGEQQMRDNGFSFEQKQIGKEKEKGADKQEQDSSKK